MPAKIFVNYRRDDDPNGAARVRDGLAAKFGKANVFMDVDNLLAGQRFDEELAKALSLCDVLIAIIGPRWTDIMKSRMRDGERDYVREEISGALARKLIVIPVRVGREGQLATLPRQEELPEDIRELVLYQKHDVVHERYGRDIAELIEAVRAIRSRSGGRGKGVGTLALAATATAALAGIGYVAATWTDEVFQWPGTSTQNERVATGKEAGEPPVPERAPKRETKSASSGAPVPPAARPKASEIRREPPRDFSAFSEKIEFKLASGFPKSAGSVDEAANLFAKRTADLSNGTLRFKVYVAGELVPTYDLLGSVANGAVDAGWAYMGWFVGKEAGYHIMSGGAPLGLDANGLARWAVSDPGRAAREAAFAAAGVKGMVCAVEGPPGLWLRKPIATADDVKGLKIAAFGLQGSAAARIGAVPVMLPTMELFPALERGVIDGALLGTPDTGYKLGLYQITRHYHYPAWDQSGARLIDLIVNQAKWDALSKDGQALLTTTCRDQLLASLQALPDEEREGLKQLAGAGVVFRRLPADVVASVRRAAKEEIEELARKSVVARRLWDSLRDFR